MTSAFEVQQANHALRVSYHNLPVEVVAMMIMIMMVMMTMTTIMIIMVVMVKLVAFMCLRKNLFILIFLI